MRPTREEFRRLQQPTPGPGRAVKRPVGWDDMEIEEYDDAGRTIEMPTEDLIIGDFFGFFDIGNPRISPSPDMVFGRTLEKARNSTKIDYKPFINKYGEAHLFTRVKDECEEAWNTILVPGKARHLSSLLKLRPASEVTGPGWYLGVLQDHADTSWFKEYNGQAGERRKKQGVKGRISEHQRTYQDESGAFHRLWAAKPSRYAVFLLLGAASPEWPEEDLPSWLNIVEMFWSLALQTLQPNSLKYYLPDEWARMTEVGVNIASPLHQGHPDAARLGMAAMFSSSDPEIRAKALAICRKGGKIMAAKYSSSDPEIREEALAKCRKGGKVKRDGQRRRHADKAIASTWRSPDPDFGDPLEVEVVCSLCRKAQQLDIASWVDEMPRYTDDGAYIVSNTKKCDVCGCRRHIPKDSSVRHIIDTTWRRNA